MSTAVKQKKKSGLRTMAPGEKLFNEGDPSHSLYIIQKGQIRLFKPKGKGFVELAILRAGEVLGEMASSMKREADEAAQLRPLFPLK